MPSANGNVHGTFPSVKPGSILLLLCAAMLVAMGCGRESQEPWRTKIAFDLRQLDAEGLYGPPGGRRSLAYEYCIPAREQLRRQVQSIDPSAVVFGQSRGRVGCGEGQWLVNGDTHQPGYAAVLRQLAERPYVSRIEQAWLE